MAPPLSQWHLQGVHRINVFIRDRAISLVDTDCNCLNVSVGYFLNCRTTLLLWLSAGVAFKLPVCILCAEGNMSTTNITRFECSFRILYCEAMNWCCRSFFVCV